MALLREKTPKLGEVATIISKILAEKTYYGYGSTQATVMALNAVVEYAKLAGRMSEDAPVNFFVNKQPIAEGSETTQQISEGKNAFAVQYNDDKATIPYSMEVAYQTFTPPNSEKAELALNTQLANQPK